MKRCIGLIALLALPACVATADRPMAAQPDQAGLCKDEGLAVFTGRTVTSDLGAELLTKSGARTLRWGPPRSAMTLDFRPDRLTVSYDDAMTVTSARCG